MTRTKTGITFIVQHVLWISGPDSSEKYMNAICHTYSQEKNWVPYLWLLLLDTCENKHSAENPNLSSMLRQVLYIGELLVPETPETWILDNDVHTHAHTTVCVYFYFNKHQNNEISVQYSFLGPQFR